MSRGLPFRSDVAIGRLEESLVLRFGNEETLRTDEADLTADDHVELKSRGLLTETAPENHWHLSFGQSDAMERVHLANTAPVEFQQALERHHLPTSDGFTGKNPDGILMMVETGVHLPERARVAKLAWENQSLLYWMQLVGPDRFRWSCFVPGETACPDCLERRMLASRKNSDAYEAVRIANDGILPSCPAPALIRLAAEFAAMELTRICAGLSSQCIGRLRAFDCVDFTATSERILPVPGCAICG